MNQQLPGPMIRVVAIGLLFFFSRSSWAVDIGCGRDTDRSGSVDNWCPGGDQDNDGYTVSQGDCNDLDFDIFPGTTWSGSKAGCPANHWRTCRVDGGGWSSEGCVDSNVRPWCPNSNLTTTHTGKKANKCFYFDPVNGSDSSGDGSWSRPWKSGRKISNSFSGNKVTPLAGSAYIFKPGTYTEKDIVSDDGFWGTCRHIFIEDHNGTATSPIWLISYPIENQLRPVLTPSTTRGVDCPAIALTNAHYFIIRGFEITGGYGPGIGTRTDSSNIEVSQVYLHDIPGNGGAGNHACIAFSQGGTNLDAHHNTVGDCNNPLQPANPNNACIYLSQASRSKVNFNNIISNKPDTPQYAFKHKHTVYDFQGEFRGNYISGVNEALGLAGGRGWSILNNLATNVETGMAMEDLGGTWFVGTSAIMNNTFIVGTIFFHLNPYQSFKSDNSAVSPESTVGGSPDPMEDVFISKNIVINKLSTTHDSSYLWGLGRYGVGENYRKFIEENHFRIGSNGYYLPNLKNNTWGLFKFFDSCTGCPSKATNYFSLSSFRSATGLEQDSIQSNPELDDRFIPANPAMASWGYAQFPESAAVDIPTSPVDLQGTIIPD